jgi:hypothetical protein
MERDQELEMIEKELRGKPTPHLHRPDELPIDDGTTCFMNQERMCASDCRAYNTNSKPGEGADCCLILASLLDIGGKMDGVIAVASLLRKQKIEAARVEAGNAPVPDPRGGKKTK